MAVANPVVPATANACQRLRLGFPHQTQNRTVTPVQHKAPPKPARARAIGGRGLGLMTVRSFGVSPMYWRSCGTKTVVLPIIMMVKPPTIKAHDVASKHARPGPPQD